MDWADHKANEIIHDVLRDGPKIETRRELIAARLRLIKCEGVSEGLNQAAEAIRK